MSEISQELQNIDEITSPDLNTIDLNEEEEIKKEPDQQEYWRIGWVLLTCFFITASTIVGTGILALPCKLVETGFNPFLLTFSSSAIMQAFILIYVVELLERTQAIQESHDQTEERLTESNEDIEGNEGKYSKKVGKNLKFLSKGPDIHSMGKFFLPRILQILFEFSVILHFISVLITYALAGSEAYSHLFEIIFGFDIYFEYLIAPFVIILTCIIIFLSKYIQQIISVITFMKGTMLTFVIVMVGVIVLGQSKGTWIDGWQYIGKPFLIGTVALGGAINTIPIIYSKMEPTKRNVKLFMITVVSALLFCAFLNILFCWFVLRIVPQKSDGTGNTLEDAAKNGVIATVPLVNIMKEKFPNLAWISYLVSIFIMLSITVSFTTMGAGWKHMMDGYTKSFSESWHKEGTLLNRLKYKFQWFKHPITFFQFFLYLVSFGFILIVALLNPNGFITIMEAFTSMALNLEAGVFIAYMMISSRKKFPKIEIPYALPGWLAWFAIIVGGYFLFAVAYDIVYYITKIIYASLGKEIPF